MNTDTPATEIGDLILTDDQKLALKEMQDFVKSPKTQVFLLKGSAGTGKTTLIKEFIKWLIINKYKYSLLATTGRAAKVLKQKTQATETKTIHGKIYRFLKINEYTEKEDQDAWVDPQGQLILNFSFNKEKEEVEVEGVIYIIDEASMISYYAERQHYTAEYGSGNLLNDLFKFAKHNKIIFVGDPCQLPPVSDDKISPALDENFLIKDLRKTVKSVMLEKVVRQSEDSEVLKMATPLRSCILSNIYPKFIKLPDPQSLNVKIKYNFQEFIDEYVDSIKKYGLTNSVIIANSNNQCDMLNKEVRLKLSFGEKVAEDDVLLVVQNSYTTRLTNGDLVVVKQILDRELRAGFSFLKVILQSIEYSQIYETLLIEDHLYNSKLNLSPEENKKLLIDFDVRMRNNGVKRNTQEYFDAMKNDPYLNAIRAKFGYAFTVHKAQGGEWPMVFLYISKSIYKLDHNSQYRWFYTALTRSSDQLRIIDGPWFEGYLSRYKREKF